jgi:hypothetical protein
VNVFCCITTQRICMRDTVRWADKANTQWRSLDSSTWALMYRLGVSIPCDTQYDLSKPHRLDTADMLIKYLKVIDVEASVFGTS